jgi:hypothetical protein
MGNTEEKPALDLKLTELLLFQWHGKEKKDETSECGSRIEAVRPTVYYPLVTQAQWK